jgi:hypothetical protein
MYACMEGHENIVEDLWEREDIGVNHKDGDRPTALDFEIDWGQVGIEVLLCNH